MGQPSSAGSAEEAVWLQAAPPFDAIDECKLEGRRRTLRSWLTEMEGLVSGGNRGSSGAEVALHVYDVTGLNAVCSLNKVLRRMGTGLFHCGVEVHGKEWSYSDTNSSQRGSTGIFSCSPGECQGHHWRESIAMGRTPLDVQQVLQLINALKARWPVADYQTLSHNCCHFSDELCRRLGVGSIPHWVVSLAGIGSGLLAAASGEVILCGCGNDGKAVCLPGVCCPARDKSTVIGCVVEVKAQEMDDILFHL